MTARLTINANSRKTAQEWLSKAPDGSVVTFERPKRSKDQNKKMWAVLTDISKAKPLGLRHIPDNWKVLMMKACGHEVQFLMGIDGEPFPAGFRTSKMNKEQMSELIEFALSWGAEHGVFFGDEAMA